MLWTPVKMLSTFVLIVIHIWADMTKVDLMNSLSLNLNELEEKTT
jgi:hypothetical protein